MGVDEHLFVSTRGLFCLVTEIVPVERVQTARLVAGPLARLTGRVAVDVDTPPGPVRARAHGRQAREARRFLDALAEHGRRARVPAAGTERWATRATLTRRTGAAGRPSFEEAGSAEPASAGASARVEDTRGPTRAEAPAPAAPPPGGRPRFLEPGAEGPESEDPGPGVTETGKNGTADTSAEDGTEGIRDTPER
jgi:putative membrane protein